MTSIVTEHFDKYILETEVRAADVLVKCVRANSKSYIPKPVFYTRFITRGGLTARQRADNAVTEWKASIIRHAEYKAQQAAEKKAARAALVNPYKIGDLLSCSWGYEQTNVDFYQVVALGKKSIKIRSIAGCRIDGTEGHDCCNVKPVADSFISDEVITKILQVRVYNGETHISLPSKFGSLSLYTQGEAGTYKSWYY